MPGGPRAMCQRQKAGRCAFIDCTSRPRRVPEPRAILQSFLQLLPDGLLGLLARWIGVAVAVQISLVVQHRGSLREALIEASTVREHLPRLKLAPLVPHDQ